MAAVVELPVDRSAHIEKLTYDPDSETLWVRFKDGSADGYAGVPPNVFAAMTRAPSVGSYFHRVIRVHYRRIERTRKEQ